MHGNPRPPSTFPPFFGGFDLYLNRGSTKRQSHRTKIDHTSTKRWGTNNPAFDLTQRSFLFTAPMLSCLPPSTFYTPFQVKIEFPPIKYQAKTAYPAIWMRLILCLLCYISRPGQYDRGTPCDSYMRVGTFRSAVGTVSRSNIEGHRTRAKKFRPRTGPKPKGLSLLYSPPRTPNLLNCGSTPKATLTFIQPL